MTENGGKHSFTRSGLRFVTTPVRYRGLPRPGLFFSLPGLIAFALALFISVQFTSPVFSAEKMKGASDNEEYIAVFDFESERGLYKDTANFLADGIRSEIVKGGRYRILE